RQAEQEDSQYEQPSHPALDPIPPSTLSRPRPSELPPRGGPCAASGSVEHSSSPSTKSSRPLGAPSTGLRADCALGPRPARAGAGAGAGAGGGGGGRRD